MVVRDVSNLLCQCKQRKSLFVCASPNGASTFSLQPDRGGTRLNCSSHSQSTQEDMHRTETCDISTGDEQINVQEDIPSIAGQPAEPLEDPDGQGNTGFSNGDRSRTFFFNFIPASSSSLVNCTALIRSSRAWILCFAKHHVSRLLSVDHLFRNNNANLGSINWQHFVNDPMRNLSISGLLLLKALSRHPLTPPPRPHTSLGRTNS